MNRLLGKVALITGSAQGIGLSIASLFAEEGAFVLLSDVHKDQPSWLTAFSPSTSAYHQLDVSCEKNWKSVSDHIQRVYGRLDILVNNAGITGLAHSIQDPEHTSLENWRAIHAINLDGVFLGCKYAIPLMKAHGGSIINMSSRSGLVGMPDAAAYASSKAAIRNHTKSVALYCAKKKYGIRCNSVHPGTILTPLWESLMDPTHRLEDLNRLEAGIPLGHMGDPIDVAYGVLYFASDESKYTTGAELVIDGGLTCGSAASLNSSLRDS